MYTLGQVQLVQKWQKCLQCLMQSTLGIVMARSHYSSDGLVIFVVKEMVKKMVLFPSWEDLGKGQIRRKKKQFTFSKLIRNFLISWEPNGWQSPDKLVLWLPASTTFSRNAFHPKRPTLFSERGALTAALLLGILRLKALLIKMWQFIILTGEYFSFRETLAFAFCSFNWGWFVS